MFDTPPPPPPKQHHPPLPLHLAFWCCASLSLGLSPCLSLSLSLSLPCTSSLSLHLRPSLPPPSLSSLAHSCFFSPSLPVESLCGSLLRVDLGILQVDSDCPESTCLLPLIFQNLSISSASLRAGSVQHPLGPDSWQFGRAGASGTLA